RCAVGTALLGELGTDELPQALMPIAEALHKGKAPATVFARLTALTRSMDEETVQAAQKLLGKMTEAGKRALDSAEPMIKDDPLDAFFALERLPSAFKDTPIASKAAEHLAKLKQTKPVALELKARGVLTVVKKVETDLASRPGSFDPSQPKFRKENAAVLRQLEQAVQQMKRSWPSARATEQVTRISEKLGVNGPCIAARQHCITSPKTSCQTKPARRRCRFSPPRRPRARGCPGCGAGLPGRRVRLWRRSAHLERRRSTETRSP